MPYPLGCCMMNGIGDGRRRAVTLATSPTPLAPTPEKTASASSMNLNLQVADIRIHGDLVFGDIVIEKAARSRIDLTRLAQSRANAPD